MPTIALIDEDGNKLTDVSKTLAAQGYRVAAYTDGAAAIDDFRASPPDLVIIDMTLPRRDGLETLRMIRMLQEKSNVPVIFLTSPAQEFNEILYPKTGVFDFVRKSYSQRLLVERVNESLKDIRAAWARGLAVQPVPEEFTPSPSLVSMFHNGLLAQYEILCASSPGEAREAPSLEYAGAILPGRLLEVIASRARRTQIGVLENKPLCDGSVFDYGFVQELSEHVSFRIDRGTEFFAQLREDLLAYLKRGGSIGGRWGRLVLADDQIAIETNHVGRPRTD